MRKASDAYRNEASDDTFFRDEIALMGMLGEEKNGPELDHGIQFPPSTIKINSARQKVQVALMKYIRKISTDPNPESTSTGPRVHSRTYKFVQKGGQAEFGICVADFGPFGSGTVGVKFPLGRDELTHTRESELLAAINKAIPGLVPSFYQDGILHPDTGIDGIAIEYLPFSVWNLFERKVFPGIQFSSTETTA
jgi:hypothetical protein